MKNCVKCHWPKKISATCAFLEAIHHQNTTLVKMTFKQIFIDNPIMNYILFTHKTWKKNFNAQISRTRNFSRFESRKYFSANANFYLRCTLTEINNINTWSRRHRRDNQSVFAQFESSISFSKFPKLSNVSDNWQNHTPTKAQPKMRRMFPLVAMLKVV